MKRAADLLVRAITVATVTLSARGAAATDAGPVAGAKTGADAAPDAARAPVAPASTGARAGQHALPPASWKYPVWPSSCRKYPLAERVACLEFVTSDWFRLSRYAEANAAVGPAKKGERRVVFMGDSITDGWSRPEAGGFFAGKPYFNRGIGGQTTGQMLGRFRADVLALSPKVVVILAGTNDIAGNTGKVTLEDIQGNLASMAELAKVHKVRVVLASILPISDDKLTREGKPIVRSLDRPPEAIRKINGVLEAYAARYGHVYLDYARAMSDSAGFLRPELSDDGLHPNAAGYAVMTPLAERAIARALGR